jgi:hypothetical protein
MEDNLKSFVNGTQPKISFGNLVVLGGMEIAIQISIGGNGNSYTNKYWGEWK